MEQNHRPLPASVLSLVGSCGGLRERIAGRLRNDPTITALVNNAGIGSAGKLLDANVDDLESMIYLNVTALTRLTLAVMPGFVTRKSGLLINIASVVALAPDLLNGTYVFEVLLKKH